MSLSSKIAVVTGGARGIDKGIGLALARQGAMVNSCISPRTHIFFNEYTDCIHICVHSSVSKAQSLVDEVNGLGTGAQAIAIRASAFDLSAPQLIMDQTLAAFKGAKIDILINNAGVGSAATTLEEITTEEYDHFMTVNVRSVIFMTQAVLPYINRNGRIVNLSSISARGGYATQSVYSASKASIEALTRVWATELGPNYGVTVNCVNPGPVDTEMYRSAGELHLSRIQEQNKRTLAAPRAGTENDVADVVTFLCEEQSR